MTSWRWLVWRASVLIVRTPAYWTATAMQALVLAAFLLAWGDGVPTIDGSVLQQLSGVQMVLLAIVLPWTAARCGSRQREAITRESATAAILPSRLLLARAAGLTLALAVCTLGGLPMLLLAQQVAAATPGDVLATLLPAAGLVGFVAVLTTWCDVLIGDRMLAWLVAAAATLLLILLPAPGRTALIALGVLAGVTAISAAADSLLRYLPTRTLRTAR